MIPEIIGSNKIGNNVVIMPQDWEIKPLVRISNIFFSNVDKKTNPDEKPVFLCNYMDVYRNNNITADLSFMKATASDSEISKFSINEGDVLFTKDSETPDDIAISAYVPKKIFNLLCGYHLSLVRPRKEFLYGKFLSFLIQSKVYRAYFEQYANGVTRYGLTTSIVKNLPVLLPPLPEQKKIADILTSVDEAIQTTQKVIEQSEKVKQGLLQELLTKGIGHTEFKQTEVGEIPIEWKAVIASNYCSSIADGTHDTPKPVNKDGYPLFTSKNLNRNNLLDTKNCYLISKNDVLAINKRSFVNKFDIIYGMIGTIGNPVIINTDEQRFAVKNVGIFRFNGDKLKSRWFFYFLQSKFIQDYIQTILTGSSQKFLSLKIIRSFKILLPPLPEQKQIADILSSVDESIQKSKDKKTQLEQVKKGLMQDLLTGKVRVKV